MKVKFDRVIALGHVLNEGDCETFVISPRAWDNLVVCQPQIVRLLCEDGHLVFMKEVIWENVPSSVNYMAAHRYMIVYTFVLRKCFEPLVDRTLTIEKGTRVKL